VVVVLCVVWQGNRNRTTHATEVNDASSRSHAICQIVLRDRSSGRMHGKLSLVDLAGTDQHAPDTPSTPQASLHPCRYGACCPYSRAGGCLNKQAHHSHQLMDLY
jgi:hypothetical protein